MIDVFYNGFNKFGRSLHDAIIANVKSALATGTSEMLFNDAKEERIKDRTGIEFVVHYYNPKKYIGPAPPPTKIITDPLSPPYNRNGIIIHLSGGPAHYIIPNKDEVKFGHLVMSSDNPTDMQGEELDFRDFSCFENIFAEFGNMGVGYYNSGVYSGCSQLHKHIQYIPYDDHPLLDAIINGEDMPFQVYKRRVDWFTTEGIKQAYKDLMEQTKKGKWGTAMKAYNFILAKKHAFLIPRVLGKHPWNLTINSLGLCGHLLIWETSDPQIKANPLQVMTDVCFPNEKFY